MALEEPNGLLAVGGDLSIQRLLRAYRSGIFPWYSQNQPILWWSPDPRAVILRENLKISRSLKKSIRKFNFEIRVDDQFSEVIRACAAPRASEPNTWITPEMIQAYEQLHQLGWAHSIETYLDNQLVGGLYGISIGRLFFGESMFTRVTDASKVAFSSMCVYLDQCGFPLIDCQVPNSHLATLGASPISRSDFLIKLKQYVNQVPETDPWNTIWPDPKQLLS